MRKYLLLIIALCLQIAARGQTITSLEDLDLSGLPQPTTAKALRYWFDDDDDRVMTASDLSGSHLIDVSGLIDGMHTLHYQVIASDDGVAYVSSVVFLKMEHGTSATASLLRYWFDDDNGSMKTATGTSGTYLLDASQMIDGLHTIHYQVTNRDRMAAYVASALFLKTGSNFGTEKVKAQKLMYWFDDETVMQQADISEGVQLIDASSLIEGLHTLHYHVLCNNGQMTPAMSTIFLRVSADAETVVAKNLRYWFDDEQTATEAEITDGVQLLDASVLIDGLHTIHYQIEDSKGTLGAPYSSIFLKMNWDTSTTTAKALRYWYDDELTTTEAAIANGTQTLDASSLIEGLHTVHYQIVDSNGTLGAPYSSVFLKMDASASTVAKSLRYWFDDDVSTVTVTTVSGGTQTLDVANLSTGLHTLNYQLIDNNGKVGIPSNRLFLKKFDKVLTEGHNRVTKYQYWLNTNSQAMQTVELASADNPYTLISLLPMQKEPIHSDCFHFEMTNDVPTIYAKNIFHVRFHDALGFFSDSEKAFMDYSVKQEVEPVGELQTTQTFPRVSDNDIRWYTMQVAQGDTAAFRMSQPATLQVFAPSGNEVFKTSESASVQWGGIHTWEDGTYYVAVHDVTGSQSNMTLDYMHMDKYDVVDWDVHTVGNGGCSTITFKGNGFRDLYRVDLYTADGDSIHSVDISHDSDAETAVTFDFCGAGLGVYDAEFHFTEEDKHVANIVTVEEAVDIELATNVSFPSTFLRGMSTTYTIKITNKGNMTAYNVPVYIYIPTKSVDDISRLSLKGLDLQALYDFMDIDYWTEEECREMKEYSDKVGEEHYFYKIKMFDNDLHDSVVVRKAYLFVTISPNITKQFTLTLHAQQKVDAYFTIPTEWNSLTEKETTGEALIRRIKIGEKYCCYHDGFECALNSFAYTMSWTAIMGLAAGQGGVTVGAEIAGCTSSFISALSNIGATFACDRDRKLWGDKLRFGKLLSWTGALGGCMTGALKAAKEVKTAISFGIDQVQMPFSLADCTQVGKNPNCPPGPQGGGSSTPYTPVDPNDINGYLSEAGSKFIADTVAKVNYTIEFENDTVFAQASAHTIVIRDTLDSRYFDLKSFLPTSVKIGEREAFLDEVTDVKTSGSVTCFLKTIDMRPEINAIAQVEGEYSQQTGIAKWTFTSLDPMTMEPTDDLMQGILPVNYNGTSGIGEVMFEVGVKPNKADGTQIPNRAGIVFDYEEPILTPTWTNIVDATAPQSHVADVKMQNDSTVTVSIAASDELSGPWRYDVYVQYGGEGSAWWKAAENVPIDTTASVKVYEGINHGFYVVVTDSAGNVEQKQAAREFTFDVFGSQVDTNTQIELAQGWNWISHNQQEPLSVDAMKSASVRMVGLTEELIKDVHLGWMGNLEELQPTQMYKVNTDESFHVQLSGLLFNAAFRSVPLYQGWNWIGYPVAHTMTPAEALAKLEAEEGDMLIGQDGLATYSVDQWTGTLTEMVPGQGYMYRSASNKNLFYNATAQASARAVKTLKVKKNDMPLPDGWAVDKRKYPNVMGMIAMLMLDYMAVEPGEWIVGAFSNGECRGLSTDVSDVLMMNVYGQGGEPIVFYAMNLETGELQPVAECEPFQVNVLGTMQQPYAMHIGEGLGISDNIRETMTNDGFVYDLQGRKVDGTQMRKGVYVTTDRNRKTTQKVIRR